MAPTVSCGSSTTWSIHAIKRPFMRCSGTTSLLNTVFADELGESRKPPAPFGLFAAKKQAFWRQDSSWILRVEGRDHSVGILAEMCKHSEHGAYRHQHPRRARGRGGSWTLFLNQLLFSQVGGCGVPITTGRERFIRLPNQK
jgi:non-canonical (house-cleaning) NTP pyrophosphatase